MKFKILFLVTVLSLALSSCGSDEPETWLKGESQNFTINSNIRTEALPSFTARDTWTATVGYGTSDTGWLSLDKESGTAGTVNLTAFISANTTNSFRSATVTVTCHDETIKYQFSQEGAGSSDTPTPSKNAKVAKIEVTNYNTAMNVTFEESIAFEYKNDAIVGATYSSYNTTTLESHEINITLDETHAGKRTLTFKESGLADEVVSTTTVDNRFATINDYAFEYNSNNFISKITKGETVFNYDTNTTSYIQSVSENGFKTTYQYNPELELRNDSNIDWNMLVRMTMLNEGILKYAPFTQIGYFGQPIFKVLYKAVIGEGTYTFNPQLDKSNSLTALDVFYRFGETSPGIKKHYAITYTD